MSMIGTALAFMAACLRPSGLRVIDADIEVPPPIDSRPAPRTQREAEQALYEQFIRALRERPGDFTQGEHTLDDSVTKMEWWTSNGQAYFRLYGVGRNCGCKNVQSSSSADTNAAWLAYEEWTAARANDPRHHPHAHEAIRLWEANQKASR